MGRRSRRRARAIGGGGDSAESSVPDHMVRVRVSDEVWADFRAAAGYRSVSSRLSELVEECVRDYRRQQVVEGTVNDRELLDALNRARALRADLTAVIGRLERRLDRPAAPRQDVHE
jgi:hypothetical protein